MTYARVLGPLTIILVQVLKFLGTVFSGPIRITSYSLSLVTIGGMGSEKAKPQTAKLQKNILYYSNGT
jgi:hypothetical protein